MHSLSRKPAACVLPIMLPCRCFGRALISHPTLVQQQQVVLAARREDKLQDVAKEIEDDGGTATVVVADACKARTSNTCIYFDVVTVVLPLGTTL